MSIFMPFNFLGTNTVQGSGGAATYTVPAGHYTYISISMSAIASAIHVADALAAGTGRTGIGAASVVDSKTINLWLMDGDAVTFSVPADSAGASIVVTVSVNAVVVGTCIAETQTGPGGLITSTHAVKGRVGFHATEYAIP